MSNLIPITKIYDIYPKYTFSKDVMRFMDDIVDIPRAEVFSKDEVVAMLRFLWNDIEDLDAPICDYASSDCISKWQVHEVIQQKISKLRGN